MREIRDIVIHCSASKNGDDSITVDVIDQWHRAKGWKMIGYHYVIHVDGSLHEGRPLEQVGAHVEGSNAHSIGICMVGTDRFTAAQWDTLREVVAGMRDRFDGAQVCGHRDFSPDLNGDGLIDPWEWMKTCPGFDVRAWLSDGMDTLWNPNHLHGEQIRGIS